MLTSGEPVSNRIVPRHTAIARIALLLAVVVVPKPMRADDLKTIVEKGGQSLIKDRSYASVVVAVLQDDKEQVFSFGKLDGNSPDGNSIYEIGSVTKVFTGILLADAVKRGEVKLDEPVQSYLPTGWTMPQRDGRSITLLQLATHTSGLHRQPYGFLPVALKYPDNPFAHYDLDEMKKGLPQTKIQCPPGAKHEYSNLGVGLIGHALAHVAKARSYEALLKERLLDPFGMADTRIELVDSEKARIVPGHTATGKKVVNWNFACMEACGAIRSSANDLIKFVRANCKPSGATQAAVEMAQQSWRELNPDRAECGLCWMRKVRKGQPTQIWHNGQTGGYHSFVGLIPGKGGVVVLCNVALTDVDPIGFRILDHIAEKK